MDLHCKLQTDSKSLDVQQIQENIGNDAAYSGMIPLQKAVKCCDEKILSFNVVSKVFGVSKSSITWGINAKRNFHDVCKNGHPSYLQSDQERALIKEIKKKDITE